jgi:2-oxoglutarate dehydrogenase E1 component
MEGIQHNYRQEMDEALEKVKRENIQAEAETLHGVWEGLSRNMPDYIEITEVNRDVLQQITTGLTTYPEGFTPHPRVAKLLETRAQMGNGQELMDWGMGENLAYGSLVWEGFNVRLSGQDVTRGTFSHRHVNLVDVNDGSDYAPLQHLKEGQGHFSAIDSSLSEAGVLGFEFGYSLADPYSLTIWEAQFGDFANGAQVIIDQFITSSEEKWLRLSGLVMLLPHGFEGQGPEHSSARLERYLQACGRQNIQVCVPTTPAQLFHLLRRQLHRNFRKPLIVMSPKSLLRHPMATSSLEDLIKGQFRKVLYEREKLNAKQVKRVVLCAGKVYYDLLAERQKRKVKNIALIRMEQFYPFPHDELGDMMSLYPNVQEVVWCQEEPRNLGGFSFVRPYLEEHLPGGLVPRYVGRARAASPATGSHKQHDEEQQSLVNEALS